MDRLLDILANLDFLTKIRISRSGSILVSPSQCGKYAGFILSENKKILYFTEAVFDSEDEAESDMKNLLKLCREFDEGELRRAGDLPAMNL